MTHRLDFHACSWTMCKLKWGKASSLCAGGGGVGGGGEGQSWIEQAEPAGAKAWDLQSTAQGGPGFP